LDTCAWPAGEQEAVAYAGRLMHVYTEAQPLYEVGVAKPGSDAPEAAHTLCVLLRACIYVIIQMPLPPHAPQGVGERERADELPALAAGALVARFVNHLNVPQRWKAFSCAPATLCTPGRGQARAHTLVADFV